MSRSPFKRLSSYGKDDVDRYFGRERETARLYNAVHESNLVVVHGGPRTGKTSLIRCGLANLLSDSDWFPIVVERGPDINTWLDRSVARATKGGHWPPGDPASSIADRVRALYHDNYRPVYLIFDDFEKLFVRGDGIEQQRFYESISQILAAGTGSKVLIVLREEYFAHLSDFESVVPNLFDCRVRVEQPNDPMLARVLLATVRAAGVELREPEVTAASILENVRDSRNKVDLGGLQVYLDWMWRADLVRQGTTTPATVTFDPALAEQVGRLEPGFAELLDMHADLSALLELRVETEERMLWQDGAAPPALIPLDKLFATLLNDPIARVHRDIKLNLEAGQSRMTAQPQVDVDVKRLEGLSGSSGKES